MNILLKKITTIFLLTTIAFGACNINAYAKNTTKSKQNTMLKVGIKKDVKQQVHKRKEFKMPVRRWIGKRTGIFPKYQKMQTQI